ncbi:hypothetical protein PGT21_006020 [Puccinia graminis f. sp. tritici]|uniref:Uncharacterized protein n=1 Tax=Puccinia graminis f. sp. tritici TaxID=56615 RepID=A0A5B0PN50_PUCGR|nr:hypothetical protein PGT21_006020 [Puccinia graminis f. sp. tritici]
MSGMSVCSFQIRETSRSATQGPPVRPENRALSLSLDLDAYVPVTPGDAERSIRSPDDNRLKVLDALSSEICTAPSAPPST